MKIATNLGTVVEVRDGVMTSFTAISSFKLGNPLVPGALLSFTPGSEAEFDGTRLLFGTDTPVALPQFQGAIKAGWVVTTEDYENGVQSAAPRSANIQFHAADTTSGKKTAVPSTTLLDEEREVGSVSRHAAGVKQGNSNNYRRGSYVPDRNSGAVEAQDGVPVRSLRTAAKSATEVTGSSIGSALSAAKTPVTEPGRGMSREEMLARMTPEQQEEYLAKVGAHKASHGVDDEVLVDRQVIGKVKSQAAKTSEGITTKMSVGGGTETYIPEASSGQVTTTETYVEGMRIVNTNGPRQAGQDKIQVKFSKAEPVSLDGRRTIARSICPDFPDNYDFDASPRKKIARLQADFEDRPDVIRAVAAADIDPEVRTRLLEEFPEAFQG